MPEFVLAEHLATKLDIQFAELPQFEQRGIIKAVKKNGHTYYSSRDVYRLKGVLHFMRTDGLSVDDAFDRVTNWNHLTQAAGAAN
jgi:DNA-binding transcriptional MerR regulator